MARVTDLPIELLQDILFLVCAPVWRPWEYNSDQTHVMPITVSQVCRYWRHFALTNPKVWTDISYVFSDIPYTPRPCPRWIYLSIERSLELPLTVHLRITGHSADDQQEGHELLLALFANVKRWKSATLFITSKGIQLNLWEELDAVVEGAPLLETLEINVTPMEADASASMLPSFLWKNAPKLTKLAIELNEMDPSDDHPELSEYTDGEDEYPIFEDPVSNWTLTNGIPYSQLTQLMLKPGIDGDLTWTEIGTIFASAKNLVSCCLLGINGSHGIPQTSNFRAVLPHLQHLDVSSSYDNVSYFTTTLLPTMNRILTAPSLRTLALLHRGDIWDKDAYGDFIHRSACPLTDLYFFLPPNDSPQGLLECLSLSPPTLTSLYMNDLVFFPEFLERMADWDTEMGRFKLCPLLQQISINTSIYLYFPDFFKDTAKMLKRRLCPPDGSPGSLKKVILSPDIRSSVASLYALTKEPYGLCIEFATISPESWSVFETGPVV